MSASVAVGTETAGTASVVWGDGARWPSALPGTEAPDCDHVRWRGDRAGFSPIGHRTAVLGRDFGRGDVGRADGRWRGCFADVLRELAGEMSPAGLSSFTTTPVAAEPVPALATTPANDEVEIPDAGLRDAIAAELGKKPGEGITARRHGDADNPVRDGSGHRGPDRTAPRDRPPRTASRPQRDRGGRGTGGTVGPNEPVARRECRGRPKAPRHAGRTPVAVPRAQRAAHRQTPSPGWTVF